MERSVKRRKFYQPLYKISRAVVLPQQVSLTGNKALQTMDVENSTANQEDEKNVQEKPRNTLKYYFNRFRYYHYCLAERLDNLIGAVCLTIIKIYFFLMGWHEQFDQQDAEMTSTMNMDDG